ncbi:hypothetical protein FKP32DRAFT_1671896 [Trametes sanguinea]|nr:hypothetical protein FKP32DRAFT_1671896 [Trametes sanguinea]
MTAVREQQLLEALRRAQLENNKREESERKLREEIEELRTMFNNLATQLQPRGSRRKRTARIDGLDMGPTSSAGEQADFDRQAVMRLGKKFAIIAEPWILPRPEDALGKPRPNLRHDDPARFQVTDREELVPWITAELYHHVPEAYHDMLENSAEFAYEARFNAIRATAIKAVRDRAAVIFNVRPDFVERNPDGIDKDTEPSLLRYLTWHPDDEAAEYDEFPPLLYPDCVQNDALVFRNPQLVKVLKVILYGPKSVQSAATEPQSSTTQGSNPKRSDKRRGGRPASGPTPNAVLWGLKQVTPGMIAFSAIAATFVLSADEEFVPRGKVTHIDYWERFRLYKKVLMTTADEPATRATIAYFQQQLFSSPQDPRAPVAPLKSPGEDAADKLIRRLRGSNAAPPAPVPSLPPPSATRAPGRAPRTAPTAPAAPTAVPARDHTAHVAQAQAPSHVHRNSARSADAGRLNDRDALKTTIPDPIPEEDEDYDEGAVSYADGADGYAEGTEGRTASEMYDSYADDADVVEDAQDAEDAEDVEDAEDADGDAEEFEEDPAVAQDDYEGLDYVEVDADEQTDLDAGQATDASDIDTLPPQPARRHDSIGLPLAPGVERAASLAREYSHRPNAPPVIQSSKPLPLPRRADVHNDSATLVPSAPRPPIPSIGVTRSVSGPVPQLAVRAPMVRSFSGSHIIARAHPGIVQDRDEAPSQAVNAVATRGNRRVQPAPATIEQDIHDRAQAPESVPEPVRPRPRPRIRRAVEPADESADEGAQVAAGSAALPSASPDSDPPATNTKPAAPARRGTTAGRKGRKAAPATVAEDTEVATPNAPSAQASNPSGTGGAARRGRVGTRSSNRVKK